MKTLHFTNSWHPTSGGIATFYRALMIAAKGRGHEMRLVVPAEKDGVEEFGGKGKIYSVASPRAPLNSDYRIILPRNYLLPGGRLREIVEQERPDLVEICDKYTLNYFAGMLRVGMFGEIPRRPVVIGFSCERMDDNVRVYVGRGGGMGKHLVRFYMKWLYFSLFDHHIANSEYTAEELRPASDGHPIRRGVWVRPMGVDCHDLSPTHRSSLGRHQLLQVMGAPAEATLLLYVGRLVPEKNLGLLLDTLETLQRQGQREWRLVLVGEGVERSRFLAEANHRIPLRVKWLGHIRDRGELARIYANCDVFVHPNSREPFGIAPLEAMASGLPLVAPDCGGVTSYANSGNAWLASPHANAFADAVSGAAREGPVRDQRVAAALATAAQFGWENAAGSVLDLYEDIVETNRGAAQRFPAYFYSTAPQGKGSPMARATASIVQRLLATR